MDQISTTSKSGTPTSTCLLLEEIISSDSLLLIGGAGIPLILDGQSIYIVVPKSRSLFRSPQRKYTVYQTCKTCSSCVYSELIDPDVRHNPVITVWLTSLCVGFNKVFPCASKIESYA
jgi:hypothetical protein